jgi:hypothetical protein
VVVGVGGVVAASCAATREGAGGLEQLDDVAGGVLEQDLRAAGAVTTSLRKLTPAWRSRATSTAMSATMRWMRFQPPGPGLVPSGMGRPAELAGPLASACGCFKRRAFGSGEATACRCAVGSTAAGCQG